ncbi:MAG: hypothetical protein DRJ43_03960 [Thermoprotei archaeon]|nr:MAG: hypothetical protein DRJ43_03960 [Thermoprotei archaeon]
MNFGEAVSVVIPCHNWKSFLKREFLPRIIDVYEDQYYAGACNLGMQIAWLKYRSKYITLLDPDAVVTKHFLNNLAAFMDDDPEAGICHIYKESGEVIPSQKVPGGLESWEVPSCSMASAIIRTEALCKIGLFGLIFKIYYETADLGLRMRREGYKCYCLTRSVIYHRGHIIEEFNPKVAYFVIRNRLIFWAKHDRGTYKKVQSSYFALLKTIERMPVDRRDVVVKAIHGGLALPGKVIKRETPPPPMIYDFWIPFRVVKG